MNAPTGIKFLPNLGLALQRALQWRLLLWWVLLTLLPALALLLPVWNTLSSQLDHTLHSAEWAQHWDFMMMLDLATVMYRGQDVFAGSGRTAVLLLLVMIPLLNGLFIANSRSTAPMTMGELLREGLRYYWPMFRMMLIALIPLAIALVVIRLSNKGVSHYSEGAILQSDVDHVKWAAQALSLIVFALANASVDAGRASLALEPTRRSAFKAWWRGLKLVLRHPLRSVVLYLGITALAAVALMIALGLRVELSNASFIGLLLGLLIAQIMAAIIAWMHYARLFGMAELTRALKPAPAA
jgi:hypothetical protein